MANPSTLYRFRIDLSDVDRGVYEKLDFRVAMHSSESEPFLLTRVIAFALNTDPALEFSKGLSDPDDPAIRAPSPNGGLALWIDIGNPSAHRLHRASKASRRVRIYTYKSPENLKREASSERIHRASEIEIFALEPAFLEQLAGTLERDNEWTLIHNTGELVLTAGDETFMTTLAEHRLE